MSVQFKDLKPGDVVSYDSGHLDYLVKIPNQDGLYVNACSKSWIDRGLRGFCEECYPFTESDYMMCEVVDHYGNGTCADALNWYEANKDNYR